MIRRTMRRPVDPVLILSKGFPPDLGGVETYSQQIALAYAAEGYRPFIITQFNGPVGWQTYNGLEVCNVGRASQIVQLVRFVKALLRLRRDVPRFALVHATTWRTAIPALLVGCHEPLGITVHGREVSATRWLFKVLARMVLSRANRILIISEEARRRCGQAASILRSSKAVVSWNGVSHDSAWQASTRNDVPVVLTACRLTEFKNVKGVLAAAAQLQAKGVTADFLIAGDGPLAGELTSLARRLKLSNVTFLGQVPRHEMASLMAAADVFLHPQISIEGGRGFESFCLAIADAMAAGLPVIAGVDGAPADYIEHGRTGFLVDGNDTDAISAQLMDCLSRTDRGRQVGLSARAFAREHFQWSQHIAPLVAMARAGGGHK